MMWIVCPSANCKGGGGGFNVCAFVGVFVMLVEGGTCVVVVG